MVYEVMIRDGAGLTVWTCGWYQGEEAWNNDAPAIDTADAQTAAKLAAQQPFACESVSLPFRGGEFRCRAFVRTRDENGVALPQEESTVTLRAIVSSVETLC